MKKLLSLTIASATLAACGSSGKTTKQTSTKGGVIQHEAQTAKTQKGALNTLTRNDELISARLVTDGGYISDKSFNQTIWEGVSAYTGTSDKFWTRPGSAESKELQTTYASIIKDTQLLVTGGFQHHAPLKQFVSKIPKGQGVIYIDGEVASPNIMSVVFKIEEAAFYSGYFAAKYISENSHEFDVKGSEGLKVGTYGGMNFKTVTAFMSGFQQGVEFFNANKEESQQKVEFLKLGSTADSYFSGNFNQGTGKALSEKLVNMGADVILPVAGPQTLDTLAVIKEKGANTLVVGVDTDQVEQYDDHTNSFLTSILKRMDIAGEKGIKHIYGEAEYKGFGLGKTVVGTMENELVGLASGGDNKLSTGDWEKLKEDEKLKAAAAKATNTFKL